MLKLKKIIPLIASLFFITPAQAEDMQVGTGALALVAGITNIYFQMPVTAKSALTFEYATVEDLELYNGDIISADGLALTYKSYLQQYANGQYWKFGVANINVTAGTSSFDGPIPVVLYGLEHEKDGFVWGVEGGLGTTAGFGLLNVYVAAQF